MANPNITGIRSMRTIPTSIVITSSAALQSVTGLPIPIAANQQIIVKYWVKLTVGATGGIRFQVAVPAGGTAFQLSFRIDNTVAPAQTIGVQQASAVVTNALANAGTHWVEIDVTVNNGATSGLVDLQMAQNTSDALSLTLLAGSKADAVSF